MAGCLFMLVPLDHRILKVHHGLRIIHYISPFGLQSCNTGDGRVRKVFGRNLSMDCSIQVPLWSWKGLLSSMVLRRLLKNYDTVPSRLWLLLSLLRMLVPSRRWERNLVALKTQTQRHKQRTIGRSITNNLDYNWLNHNGLDYGRYISILLFVFWKNSYQGLYPQRENSYNIWGVGWAGRTTIAVHLETFWVIVSFYSSYLSCM